MVSAIARKDANERVLEYVGLPHQGTHGRVPLNPRLTVASFTCGIAIISTVDQHRG